MAVFRWLKNTKLCGCSFVKLTLVSGEIGSPALTSGEREDLGTCNGDTLLSQRQESRISPLMRTNHEIRG